mmetsp:Transcript_27735/g.38331  ORF Transcript_27735/g.38331 Transcript_27735/m.38331 type:complete len:998 (+) Transcript_27735:158-3151(+)|eukprot:CAMPEP_0196570606 /NCGR_PEP_ID=MMETSP1081-20130531/750_1 /TAXON_ID=36882 /ORGANISM="Pyramimonas amylifera, Strain CCMP720" /LENGTH=997 /DNA_ID=CAMNT_0041887147 /DNA_START=112 /DNA_END=3105 /DNA_ORIENTATION=+
MSCPTLNFSSKVVMSGKLSVANSTKVISPFPKSSFHGRGTFVRSSKTARGIRRGATVLAKLDSKSADKQIDDTITLTEEDLRKSEDVIPVVKLDVPNFRTSTSAEKHLRISTHRQSTGSVKDEAALEELMVKMKQAQSEFEKYTQEQVDAIFTAVAMKANMKRMEIAEWAFEDTGMGVFEDKVVKNHFASEFIFNKYRDTKTVGVIESDHQTGLTKVAEPVGIIMGIAPVTNPTSTVIFKTLIALKTRNCIIFSPHPRAAKATAKLCRMLCDAAVKAGAPPFCIGWIDEPTLSLSSLTAHHPNISMILATGGPGMVNAAYSSGKPAIGVGSGNTPAVFHSSANIRSAVHSITMSKTFDNGMICASEQALVAESSQMDDILKEFQIQGSYLLNKEEADKVAKVVMMQSKNAPVGKFQMTPDVVGQSAYKIATMAGVKVPESTTLLIAETETIGLGSPFSYEKLCPVLAAIRAKDFTECLDMGEALLRNGGLGHTSSLFCAPDEASVIRRFNRHMPSGRVLVDMPSAYGAIGDIYNFHLAPSLTLGCGSSGGNSVSENVGPMHLLNIKNIVEKRENMLWFKVPQSIYFKNGILGEALKDLRDAGIKRVQVVTDWPMVDLGYTNKVTDILSDYGIESNVFKEVTPDPTLTCIRAGVKSMESFHPDCVIAIGGGSPMDAAKIMRVMYEHPDLDFTGLYVRFMDIRKRIVHFPKRGSKIKQLVCIPTTSGTGAEVTPFAVITDDTDTIVRKYPIADYALTPEMAIVDPQLAASMPKSLTAGTGLDALTHALESYVSVLSTDYTQGLSLQASKLIFDNLVTAQRHPTDVPARSNMHNASTLAGMAFANAFLGICHSMAHQLGHMYHIPHGLANSMLITHVIRYNASDCPTKRTAFPQYDHYQAKEQYATLARFCMLEGADMEDENKCIDALINRICEMQKDLGVPTCIKEFGIEEQMFMGSLDALAKMAYDDQCTGANPRHPLVTELKQLFINAYHGEQSLYQ